MQLSIIGLKSEMKMTVAKSQCHNCILHNAQTGLFDHIFSHHATLTRIFSLNL